MGRDKALIEVGGDPLAVRVARALEQAGASAIVAVGGDRPALTSRGLDVLADDLPGEGPLPALVTALHWSPAPILAVLACDLLAPSAEAVSATIAALSADPRAVAAVPWVDDRAQWLHAAWRTEIADDLRAAVDAGERAVHRALASFHITRVEGLDPAALADADDPGDVQGDR